MLSYTWQAPDCDVFQFVLTFISVTYIGLKNPLPNERLAECHDHATHTREEYSKTSDGDGIQGISHEIAFPGFTLTLRLILWCSQSMFLEQCINLFRTPQMMVHLSRFGLANGCELDCR